MSKHLSPCLRCEDREVGCHSWCDLYKKYDAKNKARLARQHLENEPDMYARDITSKKLDKAAKCKRDAAGRAKPSGRYP